MNLIQLDVVSAETEIYSGKAAMVIAEGVMGEIGIVYGHTPLLTQLKPGQIMIRKENQEEEYIYVQGGLLEIQPHTVTVLSDTAIRAADLDESAALAAKDRAEQMLAQKREDFNYSLAAAELAQALAQLRTIQTLRKKLKA
jgi:F-type H+-transporting ATPase subunit epsilon